MKQNPSLFSNLRALPPTAWILFLGTFLNKFGSFVLPFLAIYLTQSGYSVVQAGMAIGAYGLGNVVATVVGGYLADHIGRRKTIVLSMFSGAVSMMLLSQARSFPAILWLSGLAGLAGEFYRPASSAMLADLVPAANRVTAYSAYRMAINAGFAFGPATAGFIAGHSFFWLFVGDAGTSALFGVFALVALPEILHRPEDRIGWKAAAKAIAADRRLHRVLLGAFGIAVVFSQISSTFSLVVTHTGLSTKVYGALLSMNGVMVVLFELPLTTVTRHFRPMAVIGFGYLAVAVGFGLCAFAESVPAFVACVSTFTLGEMCAMPVASAYIAGLSPHNMRGRYMGAYGLTWTIAQVFAPALGMGLFATRPAEFWVIASAIGLASALFAFEGRRVPVAIPVQA